MLERRGAAFADELAPAVLERDGNRAAISPYPDVAEVLRALQARVRGCG